MVLVTLSLACEQPSRQHKLNVMIVHAPSNNGKYAKPCPINHLLKNKNKLVQQQPFIDLSISMVLVTLPLACEQPSRQHKLNVMIVHAPSNNGKYVKPCPINHLLKNKNKLVQQRPFIDLSISIVLKIPWLGSLECWP